MDISPSGQNISPSDSAESSHWRKISDPLGEISISYMNTHDGFLLSYMGIIPILHGQKCEKSASKMQSGETPVNSGVSFVDSVYGCRFVCTSIGTGSR